MLDVLQMRKAQLRSCCQSHASQVQRLAARPDISSQSFSCCRGGHDSRISQEEPAVIPQKYAQIPVLPKDEHGNVVDRDGKRSAALNWSRGLTYAVLTVRYGYGVPIPIEQVPETWWRLFPLSSRGRGGLWTQLVNLHDGWFARTFQPISHADLMEAARDDHSIGGTGALRGAARETREQFATALEADSRRTRRGATVQLGMLLRWEPPISGWPPPAHDPTDPATPSGSYDETSLIRFIAAFRGLGGRYVRREKGDAYYAARRWDKRRTRNEQLIVALEARMKTEGVLIKWPDGRDGEPIFRPASGDRSAV